MATQPNLGRHRDRITSAHDPLHDRPHPARILEQIGTAVGLLGHLTHRTTEVDVHDVDPVLADQSAPDLGQRVGIVIPNLHAQWPGFVRHTPQPIRMLALLVEPRESPRTDHLGELQPGAAVIAHHLAKRQIRETGHRGLQHRRRNGQAANFQRRHARR